MTRNPEKNELEFMIMEMGISVLLSTLPGQPSEEKQCEEDDDAHDEKFHK